MAKEKTSIKVRKKTWYEILAPRIFDERVIGETTVAEQTKLIGKPVLVNLMVLTNDPKKQNISIKFVIDNVKDGKATTKLTGYYLSTSSLRRFMRRATTRIDDSIVAETSDNVKIRVKSFILTRKYVTGVVSKNLRKSARNYIAKQIKKTTFEKLIHSLVTNKFQRALSQHLKKIYPIKISEIRSLFIEKEEKEISEKPKESKKEITEEKKEVKKEEKPIEKEKIKEEENKTEDKKERKPASTEEPIKK